MPTQPTGAQPTGAGMVPLAPDQGLDLALDLGLDQGAEAKRAREMLGLGLGP